MSPSIHSVPRPEPTADVDSISPPTPKIYPKKLKYEVTLEAIRETLTQRDISLHYKVPQPLVSRWKAIGLEAIQEAISSSRRRKHTIIRQPFSALEEALTASDQLTLTNLRETLKSAMTILEEMTRESSAGAEDCSEEE